MTKAIPQIQKYMSTLPHSIGLDQTVSSAESLMRDHRIRHLPVMDGGRLVGVVSDRDLKLYMSLLDSEAGEDTIGELVQEEAYTVGIDAPLDEVVATMADKRIGSALVTDHG